MYPDNDSASTSSPSSRRRGRGRHFKPTRRKRPANAPSGTSSPTLAGQEQTVETDEGDVREVRHHLEREPESVPERGYSAEQVSEVRDSESPEYAAPAEPEEPRAASRPSDRRGAVNRGPAMSRAMEHVLHVIEELKAAQEEMEIALELLEEAERQQIDDEREIKALQKALERINRFRSSPRGPERSSERSHDRDRPHDRSSERPDD